MKKYINIALTLITSLSCNSVFATTWHQTNSYCVYLHFSGQAFGQNVAAVKAHVGVLMGRDGCGLGGRSHWVSIRDVDLTPVGDHFFGKVYLEAHTGVCSPPILGPVVQYWVSYTDGTSPMPRDENVSFIPVYGLTHSVFSYDAYEAAKKALMLDFNHTTDSGTTRSDRLVFSTAD